MMTGRCACGAVRFEVAAEIRTAHHCHCHTCRSIHGTVFGSSAIAGSEGFRVLQGADRVSAYESSPGKKRCFCGDCGTHIYVLNDASPEIVTLRIGTLDPGHGIEPVRHIFCCDAEDWYRIGDDLPQADEF